MLIITQVFQDGCIYTSSYIFFLQQTQLRDQIARINVEIKNLKAERDAMESQLAREEESMRRCSDR